MKKTFERFDMKKPPVRTKWYLMPLLPILSYPDLIKHKNILTKTNMADVRPPYLLLCNHNAFMDFKVATKATWPNRCNYVVAIDGYIGREKLLRDVGCICKRKFTQNIGLIRHLKTVVKNGNIPVIYPEARYSLCGTTAVLPESLGKLCKNMGVPVVTLICHGHHVNSPFWNLHDRGVKPTEAEMKLLFNKEDLKRLSVEEINKALVEAFQYDDFAWQKEKGIRITYEGHAEGLHKVLYQCPACGTEFKMRSKGRKLFCKSCGKSWTINEFSELAADEGKTEFSHIPDWYEWERENVRKEVETGTYTSGELAVHVDSLPNAKKYIRLGQGTLVHDMNGFRVKVIADDAVKEYADNAGEIGFGTGTNASDIAQIQPVFTMEKDVPSLYSCHIEYEYLGKYGDCIDLNTLEDTWYIYPEGEDFSVTKMALATEELYEHYWRLHGYI